MQFLKILFWCLLAFVAAIFTVGNWTTVPIKLWGGLVAEVNLPLLLLVTFLAGFLPTMLYHQTVRWRLRSRLASAQRAVADIQIVTVPRAPAVAGAIATEPAPAPGAVPGAVPPGGA